MAAVSSLIPFSCNCNSNSFSVNSFPTLHSVAIIPSSGSGRKVAGSRRFSIAVQDRGVRSVPRIRAAGEEGIDTALAEQERQREEGLAEKEAEMPRDEEPSEVEKLKKDLVDSFRGTDRGLSASTETRAEIHELIHQLDSLNPTPAPTEALTRLNGKWILAYTSFTGLFPLFSKETIPWVTVEEISQTIDSNLFTIQNSIKFSSPLASTSFITNAKFEIRSPKRVQIMFEEGIIGTPKLTDSIEIPESVLVLGQTVELIAFRHLLNPLQYTAATVASSLAKTIASQSPLKIPIANSIAQSWLLTTYLDDELRISRGDMGSVFVLIKEGSSLLFS